MAFNAFRRGFRHVIQAASFTGRPQVTRLASSLSSNHSKSTLLLMKHDGCIAQSIIPKLTSPAYNSVAPISSIMNGFQKSTILSRLNESRVVTNQFDQKRTVIKFGMNRGQRKSVKAVLSRFYRLNSGLWIRPRSGRNRRKFRKTMIQNRRLSQHVLCNKQQCDMLDKMVTKYWRKPRFYVDNIYEPYERRVNFMHGRRLGPNYQF